ncbi:hypothetical protein ACPDZS_001588 [Vibrio cholerae]
MAASLQQSCLGQTLGHWIGIIVCVGIAPTKTLAKLANHAAKKYPATQGVVDLTNPERQRRLLALVPVDDVWGVGRRLSKRLNALGITTALDLANASPRAIRDQFSVVLERTARELNGESCIELEEIPPTKKQIVCSRSFGVKVTHFELLREAICEYATRATEKLRKEQQQAKLATSIRQSRRRGAGAGKSITNSDKAHRILKRLSEVDDCSLSDVIEKRLARAYNRSWDDK